MIHTNKELPSLITLDRLSYIINHIGSFCKDVKGDVCEVGVYKGGSLTRIAPLFKNKKVFGIDTFEGLPEPSEWDNVNNLKEFRGHKKGAFGDVDFKELQEYFKKNYKNVVLIKCLFPNGVIKKMFKNRTFCFVHVDVDFYQSVKDCCKFFCPKLAIDGIIMFDDYNFSSTPGAKKAVDEYFENKDNYLIRKLPTKQFFAVKMR